MIENLWELCLKKALGYSRNIPAAKMITAVGWQDVAILFLEKCEWLAWV